MSMIASETRESWEAEVVSATLTASKQILSCVILNRIVRLLHMTNNALAAGIAALMLSAVIFVLTWLVNVIARLPGSLVKNWPLIIPALLTGIAFFVVKTLHDSILPPNRERAARLPAERDGLCALRDWFRGSFEVGRQVAFSFLAGFLAVLTARILSTGFPELQSNPGLYIGVFCGMFAIGNGGYCALVIPTLASAASNYRMNLFAYDPASTTAIRIASAGFGKLALANGIVATLVIALIFTFRPWQGQVTLWIAFAWLLAGWGAVTYSFIYPNYHLSKIISREKQMQLEKLEALIEPYHARLGELSEQELDRMQNMIELRDRIAKAKDTAVDLGAWRDYISSLVLPLASFVAGFIDFSSMMRNLLP